MEADFIKKTIEGIIENFPVKTYFKEVSALPGGDILRFDLATEEDPRSLIGIDGQNLLALNHLVKKIYEKQREKNSWRELNFIVDVNGYQERRIQELKNRAQIMAERARFFKSNIECPPMNPYERMIIHSFFTEVPDIKTESTGIGRDRRVVIKYVSQE